MTCIPNSIEARDVASLVHMQTHLRKHQQEGPLIIARGDGCHVYDNSGREYIESIAGRFHFRSCLSTQLDHA